LKFNAGKLSRTLVLLGVILLWLYGNGMPAEAALVNKDIEGHWAEDVIETWMDRNWVRGYPDGSFKPNNAVTRAEYMVLVNQAFGYVTPKEISFQDVTPDQWYYETVQIASNAGYIGGYADGTMRAERPISREEAAVIMARIRRLDVSEPSAQLLSDYAGFSSWSAGYIGGVLEAGFMSGYPDGSFRPKDPITRAEALVALNQAAEPAVVYQTAGTYGPEEGLQTIAGSVQVSTGDLTLQHMQITGDLLIDEEVGTGDVTLHEVQVDGDIKVRGAGRDSLNIESSSIGGAIVVEKTAQGGTRIFLHNTQGISMILATSSAQEEVILEGDFDYVEVRGLDMLVTLQGDTVIKEMVILQPATIQLGEDVSIKNLVVQARASILGSGQVEQAYVTADDVVFEMEPAILTVAEEVVVPPFMMLPEVLEEEVFFGGGGGGGGGGTVTPPPPANAANTATVSTVKARIEEASYQMKQEDALSEEAVIGAIGDVLDQLELDGVTYEIRNGLYTEAVAGVEGTNPRGVDGTHLFQVALSKGSGDTLAEALSAQLTMLVESTRIQYSVSYVTDGNGSIQGPALQTVAYDRDAQTVTAVAYAGYAFVKWSDDLLTATRTDTQVVGDISVEASFVLTLQGSFDQFYDARKSAVWEEVTYLGIERVLPGVFNIYLDKAKLEAVLGESFTGSLKMEVDGVYLRNSTLREEFVLVGDYYLLSAVQQGYNPDITINETLGYVEGATSHRAQIHLFLDD